MMTQGRPTIYGDYSAHAVAATSGPWHIQHGKPNQTLCSTFLKGDVRHMDLHVCLLECSRCMKLGGEMKEVQLPTLDEIVAKHLLQAHDTTLHPPGEPDGKAIGSTDEDIYLLHSIYFPNCEDAFELEEVRE